MPSDKPRIYLTVEKQEKVLLQAIASKNGMSLAEFCKTVVQINAIKYKDGNIPLTPLDNSGQYGLDWS